jgi:hypothetical protein
MTYSKIHQNFSQRLNQPEALTNPEKYLGPNYQDVLNFWIYLDTLSEQEREEIAERYYALDDNVRDCAIDDARDAAGKVVGENFRNAAWFVTGWGVFGYATWELIGIQKLEEQSKPPTILPLCVKP